LDNRDHHAKKEYRQLKKLTRRQWLAMSASLAPIAVGIDSLVIEPSWLKTPMFEIPVPKLPKAMDGYTIVQLSDVHLKKLGSQHTELVAHVKKLQPQLLLFTGDIIDSIDDLPVLQELATQLKVKHKVAIMGNWEWWGDVPGAELQRGYKQVGVELMYNENRLLEKELAIVTCDDFASGHDDLERALTGYVRKSVNLFTSHSPGIFDRTTLVPHFDLALAGHTHGGQVTALGKAIVTPPGSGSYIAGFYDTKFGRSYVSQGVGTSIIPVRFACLPEMPIFRLKVA
jgi:uncharacterized protein